MRVPSTRLPCWVFSLVAACGCAAPAEESVASLTAALSAPGWHTDVSSGKPEIKTPSGAPFRIEAINWYGFETSDSVAHGLYALDYQAMLTQIVNAGFNTIRIPFSNQMWESNPTPRSGSLSACPACQGKKSRDILGLIINGAGARGLHVILDNHRSGAGNSAEANGLWYTAAYPEQSFIADWRAIQGWVNGAAPAGTAPLNYLASDGHPIVIGFDLRNEPHTGGKGSVKYLTDGATWGIGDHDPIANPNPNPFTPSCVAASTCRDWRLAAERVGTTLMGDAAANGWPYLLMFVEGISQYPVDGSADKNVTQSGWWGGMLKGPNGNSTNPGAPVVFNAGGNAAGLGAPVYDQLVYSAHDYGPALYQQPWFNAQTSYATLAALWHDQWGHLTSNIDPAWSGGAYPWSNTGHLPYTMAPVFVGEFGTGDTDASLYPSGNGSQGQWFTAMIKFVKQSSESAGPGVPVANLSWAYWALNGNDDYSLLKRDWSGVDRVEKVNTFLCAAETAHPCSHPLPDPDGGALPEPACGDGTCNAGESSCNCAGDCGAAPTTESSCSGGSDEDCDGQVDCADADCGGSPACAATSCGNALCEFGENCNSCGSDCKKAPGSPANRYCCGDGVAQPAEGNGSICNGNY